MADSNDLAVGLAIGIPSFIVLVCVFIFWCYNQKKFKKEALKDDEFDLGDNRSYIQFGEELHKPYEKPYEKPSDKLDNVHESTKENNFISSSNDSTSINNPSSHSDEFTNPKFPRHQKTNSAYDFYETFIPMLPPNGGGNSTVSNSQTNSNMNLNNYNQTPASNPPSSSPSRILGPSHVNSSKDSLTQELPAPPPVASREMQASNSSSSLSLSNGYVNNRTSLDNLAKQLNHQNFFEKLPSRTTTVNAKFKSPTRNNSSTDIFDNTLVQNDAINDNYVNYNVAHYSNSELGSPLKNTGGKPASDSASSKIEEGSVLQ